MPATAQTRTTGTELDYLRRAAHLLDRIAKMRETDARNLTAQDAADWLYENRSIWTAATFRQYRSALAFHFSGLSDDAERIVRSTTHAPRECVRPKRGQTSSRKKKCISLKHVMKLATALREHGGHWGSLAADVFEATVETGLRPVEWNSARLDGRVLVVQNAKATNGRGTGPERRLPLKPATTTKVISLLTRLAALPESEPWQRHVRVAIYQTRKELWENRPYALYTARHQFSANMKAHHTQREVADLMGHRVTRTAAKHYGKRKSAWKCLPANSGVAHTV